MAWVTEKRASLAQTHKQTLFTQKSEDNFQQVGYLKAVLQYNIGPANSDFSAL